MWEVTSQVKATSRLRTHVQTRIKDKKYHRYGGKCRKHIHLDERLVMQEMRQFFKQEPAMEAFIRRKIPNASCVASIMILSSEHAPEQRLHHDHDCGYDRCLSLIFSINNKSVDTQVTDARIPIKAPALLYDTYMLHAGPAGARNDKITLNFADLNDPKYRRIARQNGHSVRNRCEIF